MNPIFTLVAATALALAGSPIFAAPHARYSGPVMTNGSPAPPQVFAPDALSRVAGREAGRSLATAPRR